MLVILMDALPGYRLIKTEDESTTLFSERFNEACHSLSGAALETRFHYLEGCRIDECFQTFSTVRVLEVGFGTGLGWRETQRLAAGHPSKKLEFVSLEIDPTLVTWAYPGLVAQSREGLTYFELIEENATLLVLIGNARDVLPQWKEFFGPFQAIYQDAFSPKRNSELWTVEWFTLLFGLAAPGCYLSTYSSGVAIRKSLLEAGWGVYPGPAFGRKRSSTRARKGFAPDEKLIHELQKHAIMALRDHHLKGEDDSTV